MKQPVRAAISWSVLLTITLCLAAAATTAIAGHGSSDMPIWGPSVGIQFAANLQEVEIGEITSARVVDSAKLTRFINDASFSCAQGDTVKVRMVSEAMFELLFPKQGLKVGAHFSGTGDSFAAIVDWLGSLEAQE